MTRFFIYAKQRKIRMHTITQQNQTPLSVEELANRLECYCVARRWYILWVPWKKKAIELSNVQRIKRVLELPNAKAVWALFDLYFPDRLTLQVPDRIAKRHPMPQAAQGERFPDEKAMAKWAQKVLRAMNKTERE
jgi:hypothetical protein